jgi:hypothetical protein
LKSWPKPWCQECWGPAPSGCSARHVKHFSDVRHYSLTCWEATCIVLRRIWIVNYDKIWIRHVVCSVL